MKDVIDFRRHPDLKCQVWMAACKAIRNLYQNN